MSKRKKEQHAASKRGRVCKACHQWRNTWEFSATDAVCIDCKRAIGVQGLDALEVYLTPAPGIEGERHERT